jgi:hypothetical protein
MCSRKLIRYGHSSVKSRKIVRSYYTYGVKILQASSNSSSLTTNSCKASSVRVSACQRYCALSLTVLLPTSDSFSDDHRIRIQTLTDLFHLWRVPIQYQLAPCRSTHETRFPRVDTEVHLLRLEQFQDQRRRLDSIIQRSESAVGTRFQVDDNPHNILLDGFSGFQNPRNALPSLVVDLQSHLGKRSGLGVLVLNRLVFGVTGFLAIRGFSVLTQDVTGFVLGIDGLNSFKDLDLIDVQP